MSMHLTTQELDATRANIATKSSPPTLCQSWMPKRKLFGPPESSAGRSSPAQSLRTLCCPTHKAAVPDYNRSWSRSSRSCLLPRQLVPLLQSTPARLSTSPLQELAAEHAERERVV